MAWPYGTVTPIKQELQIGGSWVDITSYTRGGDNDVMIQRGYSTEQAALATSTITFNLNNTDGRFSNRNPNSPYYGQLPRNIRHRCSITGTETSLRLTDTTDITDNTYDGARAWTADKASLDITGDIDMRIDCEADDWLGRTGNILAAKYYAPTDNRSWIFWVDPYGYPSFAWSPDGTNPNRIKVKATAPITGRGRYVLRVTLDVNNGAGGNTVAFYTGTAIQGGTFTQIGSSVVTTGTTSIFNSTANLEVGTANEAGDRFQFTSTINADPFCGKVYGYQLRSSIGGVVVAYMQANAQVAGTTSWSDGLTSPNTWALDASAEITAADYRFHSEIAELPPNWDPTGTDVTVSITASDIVERLTTGQQTLKSPIYRNLTKNALDGYWPMEDGEVADRIGAYVGQAGFITDGAFGSATGLNGSAGCLSFTADTGYASGSVDKSGAANGTATHLFYFKMSSLPASSVTFMNLYYTGSTSSVFRCIISSDSTQFTMKIQDNTYTDLATQTSTFGTGVSPTSWIGMRVQLTQSGGTVNWAWGWHQVGDDVLEVWTGSFAGSFGKPRSWISYPYTGKSNLQLAHVTLARNDLGFLGSSFTDSSNGYLNERSITRARRLTYEEGVPFWWIGPDSIEEEYQGTPMGYQTTQTLVALLQEIADADGGILYSPRDKFGLAIKSYYSMLRRSGPELNYTSGHLSGQLVPKELRDFRNDVTVTRTNGGSGRYVKDTGTNSTSDVGTYAITLPRNVAGDDQLEPIAEREVALGTWDELRQTFVQVELHRAELVADSTLSAEIAGLDLGEPFNILNLPDYAGGPDEAIMRVLGYVERIGNFTRMIQFNTAPYGMFQAGEWGDASNLTQRWGALYTRLAAAVNSSAVSLSFQISDDRERWSTTDVPYDVEISGERMTVTAMGARVGTSAPYTQAATVTRGVNGISKSLPLLASVRLWDVGRWAWKPNGGD